MGKREELEAKLIENPNDVELRMVYADLLQSTGDPRGELIVLSHRGENVDDFMKLHKQALLGPIARFRKTFDHAPQPAFTWHLGFIKSAKLGYDSNGSGEIEEDEDEIDDDAETTADVAVATLLQHPSALLLEELTITMNMLDDGMYFDKVVKAIAQYGAPALRSLRLGEFRHAGSLRLGEFRHAGPDSVDNDYDYEISWSSLGDASGLWAAVPRLERLRIQLGLGGTSANGDADVIGTFDLPRLEHLEVVTGGMNADCARSFAAGKLPAAEHIALWFGSNSYGGDATVKDLEPLLAGDRVPKLVHLGLMNAEFTDDIVAALAPSKILPRVQELSLAHGTMTDAGAQTIAKHADAFKHLRQLDLDNSYLTNEGIAAVRSVCPVHSNEQREGDDEDRYVALAE